MVGEYMCFIQTYRFATIVNRKTPKQFVSGFLNNIEFMLLLDNKFFG